MTAPYVFRIVLTGGPCAGKSTALAHITDRLRSLGHEVFCAPEAATLLLGAGAGVVGVPAEQMKRFQQGVLRLSLALEDSLLAYARGTGQPAVLICDRGMMDGAAYVDAAAWTELLRDMGHSVVELRDQRYDAVVHLVTAAEGAEQFYSNQNNAVRYETPEQARGVDQRLRRAWVGHPRLRIIDNASNFEDKMRRVVAAVSAIVGVPEPARRERKFLVRQSPPPEAMPVPCEVIDVEQTYLATPDGSEARVRRRGQHGVYTFTHTSKRPVSAGERIEVERPISAREYEAHLAQADPTRQPVRKTRCVFLYANHYFELDRFLSPHAGLQLLELEVDDLAQSVSLPPFVEVEREVTGEPAFTNHALARS
jgi:CYTH domain-containing protein/predicted ATPase